MRINKKKYPILFATKEDVSLYAHLTWDANGETLALDSQESYDFESKLMAAVRRNDKTVSLCSEAFVKEAINNGKKLMYEGNSFELPTGVFLFLYKGSVILISVTKPGTIYEASGFVCWLSPFKVGFAYVFSNGGISIYNEYDHLEDHTAANGIAFVDYPLAMLLFKFHAETKTKQLPPKKKTKLHNCRYFNETQFPIDLCDLNWYTQSCQNHPFVVRGHWRMQPHGEGRKERKLKWIDTFTKQGYTKGAYKEKA